MNPGNAVTPKSRRAFFLDYPCDLAPNEPVTFVLSLHGGGMTGNWQRHYFPLVDLKDEYRLVIASPSAIKVLWEAENDDAHLQRVISFVYSAFGEKHIRRSGSPVIRTVARPRSGWRRHRRIARR